MRSEPEERPGEGSEGALTRPLRLSVLVLVAAAPLAAGSVHPPAYVPLLTAAYVLGAASWAASHWRRAHGLEAPEVPCRGLLLAFHGVVALQLVPMPPALLRALSPGSYHFRDDASLVPLAGWHPISVSPPDTARGLLFLGAMCLLYATAFREFQEGRWRRRLAGVVVATALAATVVALLQAAAGETRIYGLWRPRWDHAVFGPYVNRNHFAGYVVLAIPLSLAFAAEAVVKLARAWARRRPSWLALGEAAGSAALAHGAVAMALVAGLLASGSRGGLMAFGVSALTLTAGLARHRRVAAAVIALVVALGASWVELGGLVEGFEKRGVRGSRLELWGDALRLVPRFPLLGAGFNAFGVAYPAYQKYTPELWWGQTENELLQVLVDTGLVGAAIAAGALASLARGAARGARRGGLEAAWLAALAAACAANLVEHNWQVPATAATFAVLAGVSLRGTPPAKPVRP